MANVATGGRWSDFWVRLGSASIMAPLALLALWQGGLAWDALIAIAVSGLGGEWARLAGMRSPLVLPVFLLLIWLCALTLGFPAALITLAVLTLIAAFAFGRFAAAGIPYAGIGGLSLLWLRLQPEHGLAMTLFLVAVIWGTDIGAYLAGRLIGGAKMAPRISPGKTWSGAVGGLIIGGFCGAILAGGFHFVAIPALLTGFLLSIFAQAGDLLESAIKRHLGVKDSGNTIPGHGGLFDRLDGFLAAAPLAALLALGAHGGLALWP
jgi:phosphatidate cytidylyltransferase